MLRIIIWIVMLVGGSALGVWLDLQWFHSLFLNVYFHIFTIIFGVVLFRFVMLISRNTGRLLAKMGKEGDVSRMETNKLVTTGVYGCMRHPMHFGLLFFPLSIALIIGSPTFIFIIAPLEMLFIGMMVKLVEEPEAIRKFGDTYQQYMEDVPMFSLRLECLRQLLEEVPKDSEE